MRMTYCACILAVCVVVATSGCSRSTETPATPTASSPQNTFSYEKQVGLTGAVRGGNVAGDIDGDGTPEFFRTCPSNEGVHYQVWTGAPLEGRGRWHWYVYAGYDLEYGCTEKEYFGPK